MNDKRAHLLTDQLMFGECPRWHKGKLWFSDIVHRKVKRVDDQGTVEIVLDLDWEPSGLGWLPDDRLLVVSMRDHRLWRHDADGLVEVAKLSQFCGGELNDMVVDRYGRAYVGNIGFDYRVSPIVVKPTKLMRVDSDGSIHVAADEVFCPNGMAITPDGKTLLVSQSTVRDMLAFDIDQCGNLSNRRIYTTLPEGATYDGICLDAEGAVWVASPTSNEFLRMREGGEVVDRIDCGKNMAIACMLGGPDGRSLFCLSSEAHLIAVTRLGQSRIDVIRVDCPGACWP